MSLLKHSRRRFVKKLSFPILNTVLFLPSTITGNLFGNPDTKNEDELSRLQRLFNSSAPHTWLFTGDSITQGAKHTHGYRSYPEIFAERVRWEMRRLRDIVVNTAISGNTTVDILNDFEWRVKRFKPTVVSLMIGTNDCANRRVELNDFEQNLNQLLDNIIDSGAIPILHTPSIINMEQAVNRSSLENYITAIRNISKQRGVVLIDHWSFWSGMPKEMVLKKWMNDPVHPNGEGHLQMARYMFKEMGIFDPLAPTCQENIN